MNKQNLFASLPADLTHEVFEQVGGSNTVLIERIVSKAHVTPKGQWYDQDRNEWVMVLKGEAKLQFEGVEPIHLKVGDYIDIPAHCKHRVSWTSEETETLWLAIHY